MLHFSFDNSYSRLPANFYTPQLPQPLSQPQLIICNHAFAQQLGLDTANTDADTLAAIFSGNSIPQGALPIAQAYAGHQFGQLNPQLGDGRALLVGELITPQQQRFDWVLKGSGRTPFSRSGDGRAPLGPVLREYIICEAFAALGIPTSRALAAVSSADKVWREGAKPAAIFNRIAASHIRIGTFQYFAIRNDHSAVKQLADHVSQRHYPELDVQAPQHYIELFRAICQRQLTLINQWLSVGFVHGVMNTDNMLVSGEGIDYGPCAFLEQYQATAVFSSIDRRGRYAFNQQAAITQWNLARLAECLLPLFAADEQQAIELASAVLDEFATEHLALRQRTLARKLGLNAPAQDLSEALLTWLEDAQVDYTLIWRYLAEHIYATDARALLAELNITDDDLNTRLQLWFSQWQAKLAAEDKAAAQALMNRTNPLFIPRNHLLENAIEAAYAGDFIPFERLVKVLQQPFTPQPEYAELSLPADPAQRVTTTYCGT